MSQKSRFKEISLLSKKTEDKIKIEIDVSSSEEKQKFFEAQEIMTFLFKSLSCKNAPAKDKDLAQKIINTAAALINDERNLEFTHAPIKESQKRNQHYGRSLYVSQNLNAIAEIISEYKHKKIEAESAKKLINSILLPVLIIQDTLIKIEISDIDWALNKNPSPKEAAITLCTAIPHIFSRRYLYEECNDHKERLIKNISDADLNEMIIQLKQNQEAINGYISLAHEYFNPLSSFLPRQEKMLYHFNQARHLKEDKIYLKNNLNL